MALNHDTDPAAGALSMIMKTLPIIAAALIAAGPALAQPGNLPFGNPLGDTPIVVPDTPAPDPFAERDAALARSQALSAWRSRQAALLESARPMPGANGGGAGSYVDYGRLGQQQQQSVEASPVRRGPVPTPFGGGITSIIGGGIRPAWDRR